MAAAAHANRAFYSQCPQCTGTCACSTYSGSYTIYADITSSSLSSWNESIREQLRALDARRMLLALTAPPPPIVAAPVSFMPPAAPRPRSWLTRIARRRA